MDCDPITFSHVVAANLHTCSLARHLRQGHSRDELAAPWKGWIPHVFYMESVGRAN